MSISFFQDPHKQSIFVDLSCRGVHPPAGDYCSHADRDHTTLVDAFRIMQIEEEGRLEQGDVLDEVCMFTLHALKRIVFYP